MGIITLGLLVALTTVHPAEWSCSFETNEGFEALKAPSTPNLVYGVGSAVVMSGDAADGNQFLRFTPQSANEVLVVNFPQELAPGGSRVVRFAIRLPDDAKRSRLVISYAQTVALSRSGNQISIEVDGSPMRRLNAETDRAGWLALGIEVSGTTQTWNLLVGNEPMLRGLALIDPSPLFANVLVFSDGSLDLDTVGAATREQDPTAKEATGGALNSNSRAISQADDAKRREASFLEALRLAMAGDLAGAEALAASLTDAEPGSARWHFDLAEVLSRLAYTLHDASLFNNSSKLAESALGHLKQADSKFAGDQPKYFATASAYFAAQLEDDILGDAAHAQADFQRVLAIDPEFRAARDGLDRMQRQAGRQGQAQSASKGGN